jgi:hypothetical protein
MTDPKNVFANSIEELRDQALDCFNYCVSAQVGIPRPPVTDKHRTYLSVDETEAIVRDYSVPLEHGYCMGGSSTEELKEKLEQMFTACMERIRSNIMHEGVRLGYLDAIFDSEKNAFDFIVTEKGAQYSEQQFNEYFGITDSGDQSAD